MPSAASTLHESNVIAAWNEYLETSRSAQYMETPNRFQYEEVEDMAWRRLQQTLRVLDVRRG